MLGFKQVIAVRVDLKMGRGKLAVQVAHASVLCAEQTRRSRPEWYREWVKTGSAKIAVKVQDLDELLKVKSKAEEASLPAAVVQDRGLTQLEAGTVTCVGIGPAPSNLLDKITGDLGLL